MRQSPVWLFDLDNTLHDASGVMAMFDVSMTEYIGRELQMDAAQADALRQRYWRRYGATLLGLERHHGVRAEHYLEFTHRLPGLASALRFDARDLAAVRRLSGRKFVLTNASVHYAHRVLGLLGLAQCFDGVIGIEAMRAFGHLRPKPDARMFRVVLARLKLRPSRCVLVEDTLAHQRAARGLGLRTVWMQRHLHGNAHGPEVGARLHRKPAYVCARIRSLQGLRALFPSSPRAHRHA